MSFERPNECHVAATDFAQETIKDEQVMQIIILYTQPNAQFYKLV